MDALYQTLDQSALLSAFSKRERSAHKGHFGHVLVIGGDHGMGGAVRLAAEAALRVGAGLVSVATHPEHLSFVCANRPEIMCHAVHNKKQLRLLLKKATVIVLGPGLGQSAWSKKLFAEAIDAPQLKVVDADALNLLSEHPRKKTDWILTPHAGEASRLLKISVQAIQSDRLAALQKLQTQYGGVSVLKGEHTLISSDAEKPWMCLLGNPGMASGGMGDVLSGVVGGLLAQHFSDENAAKIGVLLHAMAGDMAASESGERGLLASDLMLFLRRLVNP